MSFDPLITLTTDFGYRDPFVGMMKGVILGINPAAVIVDITHGIAPQDILEAALTIGETHRYFPEGTVHVVVVDPGVGSSRRPLIIEAGGQYFAGPDNGVFTAVMEAHQDTSRTFRISREDIFLKSPGRTFDGRDVFAPVAARLSLGESPSSLGVPISDTVLLSMPRPKVLESHVEGEVIRIDGFGNAITNIGVDALRLIAEDLCGLKARFGQREAAVVGYYSEGADAPSIPHALINSGGLLEIFTFGRDASKEFSIARGDKVTVSAA